MSSAPAITISYNLKPPAGVVAEGLSVSKSQQFPINAIPSEGQKQYYNSLHQAVEEARKQLGSELTAWRDAVGKGELKKETPKTLKYDADEEEGEGDQA
ncbi:hypothetical protein BDZ94DRAFT_1242561 [Collybia nuda]|uniref:Uncharacterized protein n=1 Tax=Collybia nuda TaxID=64659 RepID=A0A9P6CRD9_9AGAR|nr:hypothetical protein BDZ94DRAFT_1242561 [Collybia nuda]